MISVPGFREDEVVILRKYLYNHLGHYMFDLGGYRIPKQIESYSRPSRTTIQVEKNRNGVRSPLGTIKKPGLLQRRRPGELSFVKFYKELLETYDDQRPGHYVEQFPVLIVNRGEYLGCCDEVGCNPSMKDANGVCYRDRRYFVLDLFLGYPKVAIELDYDSTHPCPEYDAARDLYNLRKYGIKTVRFKNYLYNREATKKANREVQGILDKAMSDFTTESDLWKPDYTGFSVESFKLDYKIELEILEAIREDLGYDTKTIELKTKALKRYYKVLRHTYIPASLERLKTITKIIGLELEIQE